MEPMEFESNEAALRQGAEWINSPNLEEVDKARRIFEHLLIADRNNVPFLFSAASCYMRIGQLPIAEHLFYRCLQLDPEFGETHNNLGYICNLEGRREEAQEHFKAAIALNPSVAAFYNNVATGFVNAGEPEKTFEWTDKALELDPDNTDAQWNAGLAHLELGHFREGWKGYRKGLDGGVQSSQVRKNRHYGTKDETPYWSGAKGLSVVVYGEQGVGDEILAASMLEEAAQDANIIYEAHPRLVNLMRHAFDQRFPIYGTRKVPWRDLQFPKWHRIDAKCPIFNLGGIYRNEQSDFPRKVYMRPYEAKVEKYREWLASISDRPKIGVSWKGGTTITHNELRSIPIPGWAELFRSADVDWISLQYDPADKPGWNTPIVQGFKEEYGIELNHRPEVINDLDECYGGLIHALDLVISVNTSLVHACGAMGVKCWTLTPSRPAWRYNMPGAIEIGDDKMIWYGDHVRQIRQPGDNWEPVLEQLKTELQTLL